MRYLCCPVWDAGMRWRLHPHCGCYAAEQEQDCAGWDVSVRSVVHKQPIPPDLHHTMKLQVTVYTL